jgi:hypothetical protein
MKYGKVSIKRWQAFTKDGKRLVVFDTFGEEDARQHLKSHGATENFGPAKNEEDLKEGEE